MNVYYKNNIAQRYTMMSFYMVFTFELGMSGGFKLTTEIGIRGHKLGSFTESCSLFVVSTSQFNFRKWREANGL